MPDLTCVRTPEEILARVADPEIVARDFIGTERSDLLNALTFEQAKPFLKDDAKPEEWGETEDPLAAAQEYMQFAIGKAIDHRGISASRSVSHYMAWTWLLGVDDQIDWNDYANYGAPILKRVAEVIDARWSDDAGLNRMAQGLPCREECDEGCGS